MRVARPVCGAVGTLPHAVSTISAIARAPRVRADSSSSSTRNVAPSPSTGPLWSSAKGRQPSGARLRIGDVELVVRYD